VRAVSDFDPAALRAAAEGLQSASDELRRAAEQAQARSFRVADDDRRAEVVVDGRPRVLDLRLRAEALRLGPGDLDRLLTGLINEALTQARASTQQAIFGALPGPVRRDVEKGQS
jgi:hypothetical protein